MEKLNVVRYSLGNFQTLGMKKITYWRKRSFWCDRKQKFSYKGASIRMALNFWMRLDTAFHNPKEKLFPSCISTSNLSTSYDQIITSRQSKFQKQSSFKVRTLSVSQEVIEGCSLQKMKEKKEVLGLQKQ